MSLLNLGLPAVGLMRQEITDEEVRKGLKKCSSMAEIRELAAGAGNVRNEVLQSIEPVKEKHIWATFVEGESL